MLDPSMIDCDQNTQSRVENHLKILNNKPMIKEVFHEFHHQFYSLDQEFFSGQGKRIEIGAGVCPMSELYSEVTSTDIVAADHLDGALDAQNMHLPSNSVRAIYGQNCFHHLPDPSTFFNELNRTLISGGGAILLEPYYGALASFIYPKLFAHEGFDKSQKEWTTEVSGPMGDANQAMSFNIFIRDRDIFEERFPNLEIVYLKPVNNYLRYLLSGGLNFMQLAPNWLIPALKLTEKLLTPINRYLALHHIIVIRKKP